MSLFFIVSALMNFFRKKLSNTVHSNDWNYASNMVAKRYFDTDVLAKTYFDDVKLQMDAKLWAEEYNRHNPPKKVGSHHQCKFEF